jgi:hypothetical protein
MNTCGTCRHFGPVYQMDEWTPDRDEPIEHKRYHVCRLLKHINGYTDLYHEVAGVTDGSGYHAAFCVSDEFGCNQWQGATSSGGAEHG